jgi:recombinational DNA repair protein RecT
MVRVEVIVHIAQLDLRIQKKLGPQYVILNPFGGVSY